MGIQATRLETDEEVRQALAKYRSAARELLAPVGDPAPADDNPPLFRPTQRPATPQLVVLDDGSEEGETVRLRKERFVIGRNDGDLIIPQDGQMSGRHAELQRTLSKGRYRWTLIDLHSTNGSFVRIRQAVLERGQEFIVGRTRFRFEQPLAAETSGNPADQATRSWQGNALSEALPALVKVTVEGNGQRLLVSGRELWIGKDPQYCQAVLGDDPFVSARHARIQRDEEGRWVVENNKSPNGVWLRVNKLALSGNCRFLLGEQQFLVRIPG